jgi:hypothetical protein
MYVHLYVHLYVQCSQKQNKSLAYVEYRANVTAEVGLSGLNVCQILNIYYSMKRLPNFMSNSQHFSKKMKSYYCLPKHDSDHTFLLPGRGV